MGSASQDPSYIIIGAGCFGASTALHLIITHPTSQVTLIDWTPFPNPSAAAHDLNKIIRADYPDITYMKLALEAQEQWRNDPLYSPFYHETGMLFAEDFGMGRESFSNYQALLGDDCPAVMLDPEDARERFDGIFKDAEWTGVKKNFYNPKSGWGEAEKALSALIQAAIDRGVEYLVDGVSKLVINETSVCIGVETSSGKTILADRIVLCAGAATALLIADSAPHNKSLQVNGRQVASAAVSCCVRVPESRRERFKDAPVMFNGLDHTHGKLSFLNPLKSMAMPRN
jgi:sarcosine oxidase / L-pipecolate oxidase